MRIIDTRGQQCPAPLIATRKALKAAKTGDSFRVLTSSQNALNNISHFLKDNKIDFQVGQDNGEWSITVTISVGTDQQTETEDYCNPLE
jgi:TusA-related sulfurtransferase